MKIDMKDIYRAIAELAYVVAKAERGISAEERFAFFRIINEELDAGAWIAESHFELLDEVTHPTMEHAYNAAIFELKKYKGHITTEVKDKALRILKRVAESFGGLGENEAFILSRFRKDLKDL